MSTQTRAFVRILHHERAYWAEELGTELHLLTGAPYEGGRPSGESLAASGAVLLAPATPSKIVAIGRNYRAHAKELGNEVPSEPLLFLKPPSAIVGPNGAIELPPQSQRVEHEAELAVIVGKTMRKVSPEQALEFVFGYTCANDVTARDLQRKDVQFTRGKGFDSFCPLGPRVVAGIDPSALTVRGLVNGDTRQEGNTEQMVFPVATLLSYISHVMTLSPGDVVLTGTPAGVGPLVEGDTVTVEISLIGALSNPVRHSEPR